MYLTANYRCLMEKNLYKSILIGSVAPDFRAQTTEGPINFHDWIGNSWCLLFSHPAVFTPVCTTELAVLAQKKEDFDARDIKMICLSTNDIEDYHQWVKDIKEITGVSVNYPLIADESLEIAHLYGMIHPESSETATVRSVFFIDPSKKVRAILAYPATTGRNIDEILRIFDSLQLLDNQSLATPANWNPGDDCLIPPKFKDPKQMKEMFPKGWKEFKSWYRVTPNP
jgi:alkyl hydroperoxide reductase subunit AhpC